MRRRRAILFCLCIGLLLSLVPVRAQAARVVRVGCTGMDNFLKLDENGNAHGYAAEYLDRIAQITGWEYEYVEGTWAESLKRLDDGEIDLLLPVVQTTERAQHYLFSRTACCTEFMALCARADDESLYYEDFAHFNNLRVGEIVGNELNCSFDTFAEENGFTYTAVYASDEQKLDEILREGTVDAIVLGDMSLLPEQKLIALSSFQYAYFATNYDRAVLMKRLNDALDEINLEEPLFATSLWKKYYGESFTPIKACTRAEAEYLKEGHSLVAVGDPDSRPNDSYDRNSSSFTGIYTSLTQLVSRNCGLSVTRTYSKTMEESWRMIDDGEADLIVGIYPSRRIAAEYQLQLTDPLYIEENMAVGQRGRTYSMEDALTIAAPQGFIGLQNYFTENYPNWKVLTVGTVRDCLQAVRDGKADLTYISTNMLNALELMDRYATLDRVPTFKMDLPVCIGVKEQADSALVVSLLNKGIAQLTEDEVDQCVQINTIAAVYYDSIWDLVRAYPLETLLIVAAFLVLLFSVVLCVLLMRSEHRRGQKLQDAVLLAQRANEARDHFDRLFNETACGIMQMEYNWESNRAEMRYCNRAAGELLGFVPEALGDGLNCFDRILPEEKEQLIHLMGQMRQVGDTHSMTFRVQMGESEVRWLDCSMDLVTLHEGTAAIQFVLWDATVRKLREDELVRLSEKDELTGLYNKAAMERNVRLYLSAKPENEKCAFFMIDFDDFKNANDTGGHAYGDAVLHEFGALLREVFRQDDFVGRVGGDEFAVLMKNIRQEEDARQKAEVLLVRVRDIQPTAQKMEMTCSVGIVPIISVAERFEEIYEKADAALYRAKRAGKNRYSL